MNPIKRSLFVVAAIVLSAISGRAQVPPAEQLLPADTLAVLTIPDWTRFRQVQDQSAWGQLWADPAMKPFRENLFSNVTTDFIKPLEKQLETSLTPYKELLQGQVTVAFLPPKEGSAEFATFVALIDSRDKTDLLASKLAELKKKWTESGKDLKTEKIRDIEFTTVAFSKEEIQSFLEKAFPSADEEEDEKAAGSKEKIELRVGQSKSLLIVSPSDKAIEQILARQGGGLVSPLAEQASYQKSHAMLFRDSVAHAWLNVKPIYEKVLKHAAAQPQEEPPPGMPAMRFDKILAAFGLGSLQTVSAKMAGSPDGTMVEFFAAAPEAQREGLVKLFTLEKKDSAPPAFVPADAIKFQRTRLDGQKAWATIEGIINKIDPSLAGLVQLMLSSAGKEQDPNFDLKKNLIGNLGDDIIQYQKAPKGTSVSELASPPFMVLVGSPNAAGLADAFRAVMSLMPPPFSTAPLKEREFLGRKIYSLSMAMPTAEPGIDEAAAKPAADQVLSFTASGGYVAFTTDSSILEDYLRSGENPPKPLRSVPGLAEAAQKTGGMENGYFSYANQAETMRITLQAIKNDPESFSKLLFFGLSRGEGEGQETFTRFFDLKLLPSYDQISKYLSFTITSAGATPEGFVVRAFGPRPPGLSK